MEGKSVPRNCQLYITINCTDIKINGLNLIMCVFLGMHKTGSVCDLRIFFLSDCLERQNIKSRPSLQAVFRVGSWCCHLFPPCGMPFRVLVWDLLFPHADTHITWWCYFGHSNTLFVREGYEQIWEDFLWRILYSANFSSFSHYELSTNSWKCFQIYLLFRIIHQRSLLFSAIHRQILFQKWHLVCKRSWSPTRLKKGQIASFTTLIFIQRCSWWSGLPSTCPLS